MTSTDLRHATLAALRDDPTTPVLQAIPATGDVRERTLPAPHVERLLIWAGISGYHEHTRVELLGTLPAPIGLHVQPGGDQPTLGAAPIWLSGHALPNDVHGWRLALTNRPGTEARHVTLTRAGRIHDAGTRVQMDAVMEHATARRLAAGRERLERENPTRALLARLERAARTRRGAEQASLDADTEWRDLVCEIAQARDEGRMSVHLEDFLRAAGGGPRHALTVEELAAAVERIAEG